MYIKIAEIKRNIINIVLHINPRIQREGKFLTITYPSKNIECKLNVNDYECIHDVIVLLTHHLTSRAITAKIKSKACIMYFAYISKIQIT